MQVNDLLKDLNKEQKQAVVHKKGPLLIVAGAGTGKTTIITRRLVYLILSNQVKANEILAVTFTDKAAQEMQERVDQLLPYGYFDLWIDTFHGLCQRILEEHSLDIGLSSNFKILNQAQQALLIKQNFERFDLDYYKPLGNPTKFIYHLVKHFSRLKDQLVSPQEYLEYVKRLKEKSDQVLSGKALSQEIKKFQELAQAYDVYEKLLLENNCLDFGGIILYTLKLLRERKNILNYYRQKFKYILVDEFQDTNYAQYELIKLLAKPKNNLTVVSDDDQAIFRFRGASYNNVIQFKKDYKKYNFKEIILTTNYRSRQNILDLAYRFIQNNNPYRLEVQLKNRQGTKKLKAVKGQEGIIEYNIYKTEEEETEGVIKKIIELKNKDQSASWNDFAILIRSNNEAQRFEQGLRRASIIYEFPSSTGLYLKPVILDIINYLDLLDDYHESRALYRIITSPIFSKTITNQDLKNILHYSKKKSLSLYETLKLSKKLNLSFSAIQDIDRLLFLIEKHSNLSKREPVSKIVYLFLQESGYLKILSNKARKGDFQALESLNHLNQFFKKIEEFEKASKDFSVKAFNEQIKTSMEVGELGSVEYEQEGPESVKLSTIHSAKGLEFKYVFLPGLVERRFPTIERKQEIPIPDELIKEIIPEGDVHLQEERRLFYVAMTRAKYGLFLSSAQYYNGTRKRKPSRFLFELGLVKDQKSDKKAEQKEFEFIKKMDKHLTKIDDRLLVKQYYQIPKEFSFTQLRAFETCPLQYKYAHILKIPAPSKASFSFGKTIHNTLFKFLHFLIHEPKQDKLFKDNKLTHNKSIDLPPLKTLLEIYEQSWIDDWYEDKQQKQRYKEKGKKILKDFYEKIKKNRPKPIYLEANFRFKINNYIIKGKIDRIDLIDERNQEIELIDYKTGNIPKKLSLEEKEQLLIYQLGAEKIFQKKVKKLTYWYLEENKPLSFLGSTQELQKIKEKIIKTIEEIKLSNFNPKPSPQKCQHCDFKNICPFRAY